MKSGCPPILITIHWRLSYLETINIFLVKEIKQLFPAGLKIDGSPQNSFTTLIHLRGYPLCMVPLWAGCFVRMAYAELSQHLMMV